MTSLTELETKEIEIAARKWSRTIMGVEVSIIQENPREVDAYIAGSTAMAEEKESELSLLKEISAKMAKDLKYYCEGYNDLMDREIDSSDYSHSKALAEYQTLLEG